MLACTGHHATFVTFALLENGPQEAQIHACPAKQDISVLVGPRSKIVMVRVLLAGMEILFQPLQSVLVHAHLEDTALRVRLHQNAQGFVNQVAMVQVAVTITIVMVAVLPANIVKLVLLIAIFAQQDTINPTAVEVFVTLVVLVAMARK